MSMLRELREEREVRHARTAAAEPPLRLVTPDPGARGRRTVRVLTVLASAAACAVLFGTVCTHVLLTQGQAELDRLEARTADAEAAHEQLQVEVAELESPARIVPAARERLGMVPPPVVVYLTPGAPRIPVPSTATAPSTTTPASKTAHP